VGVKARRRFGNAGEIVCLKERRFAELGRKRDIMNEVNLLQRAQSHPNVIKFHSHFWDHGSGTLVMVLEFVNGGDLYAEVLRRRTLRQYFPEAWLPRRSRSLAASLTGAPFPLSQEVIWKLFYQICLGINHLHKLGTAFVQLPLRLARPHVCARRNHSPRPEGSPLVRARLHASHAVVWSKRLSTS
jgi:serine/threonine protein kinase